MVGDLIGRRFSGAGHRRRDTKPLSALAGHRGAEQRGHCGEYTQARRKPVPARGRWSAEPQGHYGAGASLDSNTSVPLQSAALRPCTATGVTDLVGREEELELLLRRWSKAKTGEGQVVLLSGEPGIGKSRSTVALLERLAASHIRDCATSARHSALTAPFIRSSTRWNALPGSLTTMPRKQGSTSSCDADADLDLEAGCAALRRNADASERRTLSALDLTPPQRRQRTLEALVSQMEALARENPVLMILRGCALDGPDEPGSVLV